MPIVSQFFDIIIRMFFDEHAPLTFTRSTANTRRLSISARWIIEGRLPRRALALVLDWAELHQTELLQDWALCQRHLHPNKIEPLG